MPRASPYTPDGTGKICAACTEAKPLSCFHPISGGVGKVRAYCRPCQKVRAAALYIINKPSISETNRRYRTNPDNLKRQQARVRAWHYKTHYGITEDEKRAMEKQQGNMCAICRVPFIELDHRRVHVDHDHATGKIRGILCHSCNQVLGQARDSVVVLNSAVAYLTLAEMRERVANGQPIE